MTNDEDSFACLLSRLEIKAARYALAVGVTALNSHQLPCFKNRKQTKQNNATDTFGYHNYSRELPSFAKPDRIAAVSL